MAILRLLPAGAQEITEHNIPDCFASILDKKVNAVALNCLETFVDWILSYVYDAYNTLYELKIEMHAFHIQRGTGEVCVHLFRDGTPLFDLTEGQEMRIVTVYGQDRPSVRDADGRKDLVFGQIVDQNIRFGREVGTQHLTTITDPQGRRGIFEYGTAEENLRSCRRRWYVDETDALWARTPLNGIEPYRREFFGSALQTFGITLPHKAVLSEQGLNIFNACETAEVTHTKISQPDEPDQYLLQIDGSSLIDRARNNINFEVDDIRNDFIIISDYKHEKNEKSFLIQQSGKDDLVIERISRTFGPKYLPQPKPRLVAVPHMPKAPA